MENIIHPKNKQLQKYIEYFWLLKGAKNDSIKPIVTPETRFEIILSFADSTVFEGKGSNNLPLKGSFLSFIRQETFQINCCSTVDYLAIRFYPHGFYRFLGFPLWEAPGQVQELDVLAGKFWKNLTEKIGNIPDLATRLNVLELELLQRLKTSNFDQSWILNGILSTIHQAKGTLNIGQICQKIDVYPKKVEREFKKYIGLMPKKYSRIVRISEIQKYVSFNKHIDWSDIAYRFGYFDQAHFIKEFNHFIGCSPVKYQEILQKVS